ncbi:hypothetical protein FF38_04207 [Lucilia cuprina]|uniref:Uncharacterized protein n=1 Tax=Lucilia cuprina TaxID=7375 RepID=A0A0L0BL74_LUCCU|nr:hypothetical protein FF38_04207 [Lucilia cuprina]
MSASNETSKKKHNSSWETEDWAQGWLKSVSFASRSYQITTNPENLSCCVACTIPVTTNSKIMDIKIAIFTARHSSISSVDHLTNMLKSFSIKEFDKLRLHRTKCSAIIKYTIAPAIL